MAYHTSTGSIIYNPYRGEMKRRTKGWCIITVDKEITRYYRWWLQYQYHIHLQPPSWDAHISVVRAEPIQDEFQQYWKKYDKRRVEFSYEHGYIHKFRSGRNDENNVPGDYYVINVKCPIIDEMRNELGLKVFNNYHLTIGRTYEYQARKVKGFVKDKR